MSVAVSAGAQVGHTRTAIALCGDVLRQDRMLDAGGSAHSHAEGAAQLAQLLAPFDYRVQAVSLHEYLHRPIRAMPPNAFRPPRVRHFVDFLQAELSRRLAAEGEDALAAAFKREP